MVRVDWRLSSAILTISKKFARNQLQAYPDRKSFNGAFVAYLIQKKNS